MAVDPCCGQDDGRNCAETVDFEYAEADPEHPGPHSEGMADDDFPV